MSTPFYPSATHILPLTAIRRERRLPWRGEVLISTRQQVEPSDVVARAARPGAYAVIDVAQQLGVPVHRAGKYYLKQPGESVQQGELLARRKGRLAGGRKITSPVEGRVVAAVGGRIVIEPQSDLFELRAWLSGLVTNTTAGLGVTIETAGALIQGVWGTRREGYGSLTMGVEQPDAVLDGERIEVAHHGSILVCGATLDLNLLAKAQEMQVRGLIVGGVPADLREEISQHLLPVIATEGMGRIPISSPIFRLLQANEGHETMLLAPAPGRPWVDRPEIIIPLPASTLPAPPPRPGTELTAGHKVRIIRAPRRGSVGIVKEMYDESRIVDNGIKYPGADVVLETGEVVFVPFVNLDVVG